MTRTALLIAVLAVLPLAASYCNLKTYHVRPALVFVASC
jgi:hypothetical protein